MQETPHLQPVRAAGETSKRGLGWMFLVALISVLATATLLRRITPPASSYPVADRLQYYLDHPEEFDTLFVGSSRVYRGIVPKQFDKRMREYGTPTRSLNLGAPAMRSPEVDRLVRLLISRPRPGLKNIFIGRGVNTPAEEDHTLRTVEWHTARQTLTAIRNTTQADLRAEDKRYVVAQHLRQFVRRELNYGFGPTLWSRLVATVDASPDWLENGGYKSLESDRGQWVQRRRRRFLDKQEEYEREVASARVHSRRRRRPSTRAALEALAQQGQLVKEAGLQPVALLAPGLGYLRKVDLPGNNNVLLLNYDDTQRYPELFKASNRYDENHLNEKTALYYTDLVAQAFAASLTNSEQP